MPVRPCDYLDVVDPGALDLDLNRDPAEVMAARYRNMIIGSAVGVVPLTRTSISVVEDRRVQVLELAAGAHQPASIAHIQSIQIERSTGAGLFFVDVEVRMEHSQGIGASRQRYRPGQRLPVFPGVGLNRQRWEMPSIMPSLPVETVQGIYPAPIGLVPSLRIVVLECSGHRVEDAMAHRARRVVHGRVVRVRERHGIGGARGGLLDVEPEEVVVGPARARPVAIGGRRRIALEKRHRIEDTGVRIVRVQRAGIDYTVCAEDGIVFVLESVTLPIIGLDPRGLELVDILGVIEARRCAVGGGRHRVGHDVVGSEDLGVGQVVLRHVRDQLHRRSTRTVPRPFYPSQEVPVVAGRLRYPPCGDSPRSGRQRESGSLGRRIRIGHDPSATGRWHRE